MNEHAQPQVARNYLRELDIALAGVSDVERCAIVEGATEEPSGLDTEAAAARIEKLGDPGFIAAEARAENWTDPAASVMTTGGEPRWYIVLTSLLVAFGGIVVPLLPVFYDVAWSGILFFTVLNVAVGPWLLVMTLRRRVQT